jgi:hypothetical protein
MPKMLSLPRLMEAYWWPMMVETDSVAFTSPEKLQAESAGSACAYGMRMMAMRAHHGTSGMTTMTCDTTAKVTASAMAYRIFRRPCAYLELLAVPGCRQDAFNQSQRDLVLNDGIAPGHRNKELVLDVNEVIGLPMQPLSAAARSRRV